LGISLLRDLRAVKPRPVVAAPVEWSDKDKALLIRGFAAPNGRGCGDRKPTSPLRGWERC
jgi:hypothetical protein